MPCPPQVPISIIPPVTSGVGPLVWQNGNQIARLNAPITQSIVCYDGSKTRFGDGSVQFPINLPNLQQGNGSPQFYVGSNSSGTLAFYSNPSISGAFLNANQTFTGSNTFTQPIVASGGVDGNVTGNLTGNVTGNVTGNLTGNASTATTATTATSAGSATNLAAGARGSIPVQSASGVTTFLPVSGSPGAVLCLEGAGYPNLYPEWLQQAPVAANLYYPYIGFPTAGAIPYQTDISSTAFLPLGTNGQVLLSNGTSAPYWGNNVPSATTATNIASGSTGALIYQTASSTTTSLNIGSSNQILTSNGSNPIWQTGIKGVTNGTDAASGFVGEYNFLQQTTATYPSTLGTPWSVGGTYITLTAGDWDVSGTITLIPTFNNNVTYTLQGGISTSSSSFAITGQDSYCQFVYHSGESGTGTNYKTTFQVPTVRMSVTASTTVYLVGNGTSNLNSISGYGTIRARRMR